MTDSDSDIECVFEGNNGKPSTSTTVDTITIKDDSDDSILSSHENLNDNVSFNNEGNESPDLPQQPEDWEALFGSANKASGSATSSQVEDSFSLSQTTDVTHSTVDDPDATLTSLNVSYNSRRSASGRRSASSDIICLDSPPPRQAVNQPINERQKSPFDVADLSFSGCAIRSPSRSRKRASNCLLTPQTASGSQSSRLAVNPKGITGSPLIGSRSATKNLKKTKKPQVENYKVDLPTVSGLDDREAKKFEKEMTNLEKKRLAEKKRLEKEEKDRERKAVKLQKESDKLQKQALREAYKPLQGGKKSLNHLQIHVPQAMLDAMGGTELEEAIAEEEATINLIPVDAVDDAVNVIRWTRGRVTAVIDSADQSNKLSTTTQDVEEKDLLIQIPRKTLVSAIDYYKQSRSGGTGLSARDSLTSLYRHWSTQYPEKALHFFAYGMDAYFKNQLQNAVYGDKRPPRSKPTRKSILEIPYEITHADMEEAFIDFNCRSNQVLLIESPKEFARLLITTHKAVADSTFKLMKQQESALFDAISANTKTNGVFVPEDSLDGYKELWIRQLEQFSLVSREVAVTIADLYPSPRLLMEAYDKCDSLQEKESLVEDVIVRRGTERRIGPKMSKLLCVFMCSTDGGLVLE